MMMAECAVDHLFMIHVVLVHINFTISCSLSLLVSRLNNAHALIGVSEFGVFDDG